MQKVSHLWNVNQFIATLNFSESTKLQSCYIQKCRDLSEEIPLPSQRFGPSVMCSYCGCIWNTTNYSIRMSKGRPLSKSITKILHSMNRNGKVVQKLRRNLSTQIPMNKPQKEKGKKISTESVQSLQKWKKKRSKDTTAGLIVPRTVDTDANKVTERSIEINKKEVPRTLNFKNSKQKLRKLNINRLKDVVNQGFSAPLKKNSLQQFLAELS